MDDGEVRFATKWVQLSDVRFESRAGMTGDQFNARFNQLRETYRVIDISAYNTPDGPRYADIWVENKAGVKWHVKPWTPQISMGALIAGMKLNGFAPTRVEGYAKDVMTGGAGFSLTLRGSRAKARPTAST